MQIKSAFVAAAILAFCDALATPIRARSPYVVKETHFVPKEWQKQDRSHGGKTIALQIGLKQGRFEELDRHLHEGKKPPNEACFVTINRLLNFNSLGS